MINTYDDFVDRITSTIKIRSKNYVNTDCNLDYLVSTIYNDIMTKINLGYIKDGYLMDGSEIFEIRSDNKDPDEPDNPENVATEHYDMATDIVDDEDYKINKLLQRVDKYKYKWTTQYMMDEYNGKYIYFVRPVHYDIQVLPSNMYQEIFSAMIEGMMYEIAVSIPSQIDDAVSNRFYQRYFNERENLINRFPQIQYVDENIPVRNNKWLAT